MFAISDQYLLDLRIDGKNFETALRVLSLTLFDNIQLLAPTMEIEFDDQLNAYTEFGPFNGREIFQVAIARSIGDDLQDHSFQSYDGVVFGNVTNHKHMLGLISTRAFPLLAPARFKSYASQKISAIVAAIAAEREVGLTTTDIEATADTYDLFCPGWTYATFLKWLSRRAVSNQHQTAGFICHIDLDDKLNFFSYDYAYQRVKPSSAVKTLTATQHEETDTDIPILSYIPVIQAGRRIYDGEASGKTLGYFDFESTEFTSSPFTLGATRHKPLCDQVSMKINESDAEDVWEYAAYPTADAKSLGLAKAESDIISDSETIMRMDVTIEGNLDFSPAQKVKVLIPSPHAERQVNQAFSGEWLIEGIAHQLIPIFKTKLTLVRNGVDGADDKQLVTL